MIDPKTWKGDDLKGVWVVTLKIDGVRVHIKDGVAVSKNGKPLYNIEGALDGVYEAYVNDSWSSTITAVKTKYGSPIDLDDLYRLDSSRLDTRLVLHSAIKNPCSASIRTLMDIAVKAGHEGLVLRQGDTWLKVKPSETHDIVIRGLIEGKGKNVGKLGSFITNRGNVGIGYKGSLTSGIRSMYWRLGSDMIGLTMEVVCWELTAKGKFRHPKFKRLRPDKDAAY